MLSMPKLRKTFVKNSQFLTKAHTLAYSLVALQEMNLAYKYPLIYWNCACLITDSGGTDDNIDSDEHKSTNYTKISEAIGKFKQAGIIIEPPNVNSSNFTFTPDDKQNKIYFGLSGILNVGKNIILDTIQNRPYVSFEDFLNKVKPNKQSVISLIKGGAFDSFGERKQIMIKYVWMTCGKKDKVNLQNMTALIRLGLIPDVLSFQKSVFEFNRYLKDICKPRDGKFQLDARATNFLNQHYSNINFDSALDAKVWEKVYNAEMDVVRKWFKDNQKETVYQLNKAIFAQDWNKYALGSYSAWEMEVLCFYYHDHELKDVNRTRYGLSDWGKMGQEPIVEAVLHRGDSNIPIYRLNKIYGTCIAKNKLRSSITLLTTSGIVNIRFRPEMFSLYDRQVSVPNPETGKKTVIEKSWFTRGTKLMIMGIRRGDEFVPKKYAATPGHTLTKIVSVGANGSLMLQNERLKGDLEDEPEGN